MTTAQEASAAPSLLGGPLASGVRLISSNQEVTFELYARVVLPVDGYVFWVRATALSDSAVINASPLNSYTPNQPQISVLPVSFKAQGSLHYATDVRQEEVANYSINRVVFTALESVQNLNDVGGDLLYIATFDLPEPTDSDDPANVTPVRFAFNTRGSYYKQANLWHYRGDAIYSFMTTQVIDDPRLLLNKQVVSNSLPAWLAFNQYAPAWPVPVIRPRVTLYPSYLVPDNLEPPYGVVHISSTDSNQTQPFLDSRTSQWSGAEDEIMVTLYGTGNDVAESLLYALLQYSYDTERFGLMNMPVVRDDKQTQSELSVIAQRKSIAFRVSYNQTSMRDVARQLIESCVPTIYVDNIVVPPAIAEMV